MTSSVALGPDVFGLVGIAPAAMARWANALMGFASTTTREGLRDESAYPPETAHVVEGGLLLMRVAFPTGDELTMKLSSKEWCWVDRGVQ